MTDKAKGFTHSDLTRNAMRVQDNPPSSAKETLSSEALGNDHPPANTPQPIEPVVKQPQHRMTINIPFAMHQELRRQSFETGRTMTELLIRAWDHAQGR